jgi:hypothetical protein
MEKKVGYCYPSGLEKTLCKWEVYVPLVTKGLKEMTTLTEGFPSFFLSCKANARVKPAKRGGTARTLHSCCVALCILCVVLRIFVFSVLFVL